MKEPITWVKAGSRFGMIVMCLWGAGALAPSPNVYDGPGMFVAIGVLWYIMDSVEGRL